MAVLTSVVLCVKNGAQTLRPQLEALAAQQVDADWELVLVDNGSTDATVVVFRQWQAIASHLPSRCVPAPGAQGLAAARNCGVRAAAGERLLFCDADDVVLPGWVDALSRALGQADVVGGSLLVDRLNTREVTAWRAPFFTAPTRALPEFGLPYVVGANFGATRQAIDALGGFDESLDRSNEEVDFSIRAQLSGFRLMLVPEAQVQYRFRETIEQMGRQMRSYGRGAAQIRAKHGSALGLPPLRLSDEGREAAMLMRLRVKQRWLDDDQRAHFVQLWNYKVGFWSGLASARTRAMTVCRLRSSS